MRRPVDTPNYAWERHGTVIRCVETSSRTSAENWMTCLANVPHGLKRSAMLYLDQRSCGATIARHFPPQSMHCCYCNTLLTISIVDLAKSEASGGKRPLM